MKTVWFTIREGVSLDRQSEVLKEIRGWPMVHSAMRLSANFSSEAYRMCYARVFAWGSDTDLQSRLFEVAEIENAERDKLAAQPAPRKRPKGMPEANRDGVIPTLNGFGVSFPSIQHERAEFVALAAKTKAWSLDIGCAYGLHSIEAIRRGARVVANDIDARHLSMLRQQLTDTEALSLRTRQGKFPNVTLPANSFGAILASGVLHFMDEPTIERAIGKMHNLLQSGGKAFIIVATPFSKLTEKFIAEFEARKGAGSRWPGVFKQEFDANMPEQLQVFDKDSLSRLFKERGFEIESTRYVASARSEIALDGREGLAMRVRKP